MEKDLARKGLPNLPFHASPPMYGKEPYKGLEMEVRKKMLACFEAFCRRAPFSCKSFSYKRSEVEGPSLFTARFKRDLVVFLTDNLEHFQSFERVKIYYDNGQQMVTAALHSALDFILSNWVQMGLTGTNCDKLQQTGESFRLLSGSSTS